MFFDLLANLVRCIDSDCSSSMSASRERMSLRDAAPSTPVPGMPKAVHDACSDSEEAFGSLDIVARPDHDESTSRTLALLATHLEQGVRLIDLPDYVDKHEIERLIDLGAIRTSCDEFGELRYTLSPVGIRFRVQMKVTSAICDMDFGLSSPKQRALHLASKVELLHKCFAIGFRPLDSLPETGSSMTRDGQQFVLAKGLFKSKKYLETLCMSPQMFLDGLRAFAHNGTHH